MSVVAKVFIVVVALLSLVFLGVSATLYSYRTDWRMATLHLQQQYQRMVQQKNETIRAQEQQVESLSRFLQVRDSENQQIRDQIDDLGSGLAQSEARLAAAQQQNSIIMQQNSTLLETLARKDQDIASLREEVRRQGTELAQANEDKRTAQQQVARLMSQLGETEQHLGELRTLYETNRRRLADLQLVVDALNAAGVPISLLVVGSPPTPPVDGIVMAVKTDIDPNLVLLSVGADDNVQVGFVFTVYRGGTFVGQVIVDRVLPDVSACRVMFTAEGQSIREGDSAATRL